MNPILRPITLACLVAAAAATAAEPAAERAAPAATPAAPAAPENPWLPRVALDGRLRAETADIAGVTATAYTWRHRLSLETGPRTFSFLVEGEHTWRLNDAGDYSAYPSPYGSGTHPIIADPDNLALNRLQLSVGASTDPIGLVVGRQAILWDDQRFVGAVGWRQNDQTFDAAALRLGSSEKAWVDYVYLGQVNRIYGDDAPDLGLQRLKGDSHLVRAAIKAPAGHTITAFFHRLQFDVEAASGTVANSNKRLDTETAGVEWRGAAGELGGWKPTWVLTYATQANVESNPVNYRATYGRARFDLAQSGWKLGLGYERLGSDAGLEAFQFPLGTNHLYQGYADLFLTTPRDGLRDAHLVLETPKDPLGITHRLAVHHFATDHQSKDLGWEADWNARYAIGEKAYVLLAIAMYQGNGTQANTTTNTAANTSRVSLEVGYKF